MQSQIQLRYPRADQPTYAREVLRFRTGDVTKCFEVARGAGADVWDALALWLTEDVASVELQVAEAIIPLTRAPGKESVYTTGPAGAQCVRLDAAPPPRLVLRARANSRLAPSGTELIREIYLAVRTYAHLPKTDKDVANHSDVVETTISGKFESLAHAAAAGGQNVCDLPLTESAVIWPCWYHRQASPPAPTLPVCRWLNEPWTTVAWDPRATAVCILGEGGIVIVETNHAADLAALRATEPIPDTFHYGNALRTHCREIWDGSVI